MNSKKNNTRRKYCKIKEKTINKWFIIYNEAKKQKNTGLKES